MLRSQQLPKRKESCLRQPRPSERSIQFGCERKMQTQLSIQLQTQRPRCDFRSTYERKRTAGTKKTQTSGARLRIAGMSGHSSCYNSTLNRRPSLKFTLPAIATNKCQLLINAVTGKVGASTRSGFSDLLLNHKSGAFVLTQSSKLRMPQPIDLCFILHLSINWIALPS
jgi:hypothetical protein